MNIACNPNHNYVFKNHMHEKEDQRETHQTANNAEMMGNLFLLLISQIFIIKKKIILNPPKEFFKVQFFKLFSNDFSQLLSHCCFCKIFIYSFLAVLGLHCCVGFPLVAASGAIL